MEVTMELKTFYSPSISHFSYMIGYEEGVIVIDPKRDIENYLDTAKKWELPITHILLTHHHADFAAGHLRLKAKTNAEIIMGVGAEPKFSVHEMKEGERIILGSVEIEIIETPGHTPELISFLLTDRLSSNKPLAIFTGDSLFAGDLGRPDLFGLKRQEELTQKLWQTVNKFKRLPDYLLVYPAHGAGSLCGKRVGQRNPTSIGFEKENNPMLALTNYETFRNELFKAMPTPPAYYFECSKKNKSGDSLEMPFYELRPFTTRELEHFKGEIIDLRDQAGFSSFHIPDSLNMAADIHFSLLAGFSLGLGDEIILVGDMADIEKASLTLYRMGYDNVLGYLSKGIDSWRVAGFFGESFPYISPKDALALTKQGKAVILDVRTETEHEEKSIPDAIYIPLAKIKKESPKLPKDKVIISVCGHGCRSSLVASMLKRSNFKVGVIAGGILA
jgi:glyoxylase-like metal-dependent hydrolase (beta-lactamase superfamily II)/rhodanese-related sulfurtransferase